MVNKQFTYKVNSNGADITLQVSIILAEESYNFQFQISKCKLKNSPVH